MPSNTSIDLTSLDFDTNVTNLKTWLRAQPTFLDYDFDGSNMSVLLGLLAYNTFQNAFYLNFVASESYLDSAQLRNSVVSHAKELNYIPRSPRSAKATVALNFTANTNVVTIPRGTSFTSLVGTDLLTFVTAQDSVYFSSNNTFAIPSLDIYEGQILTNQFVVNYEDTTQRFVIADPGIDTQSLSVTTIEDNSGTVLTYTQALTTLDLDENSQVYFLQGAEDGKYEIVFGDDVIGRRPKDNGIVLVSYRTCHDVAGNGAAKFALDNAFTSFTSSPTINTVNVARGGAAPETLASVKFYAPRYFQTQQRAINTSDYEIILKQNFPEINAIAAYGGEEVNPPQYGKVFIAVDISDVDGLPSSKVDEYYDYIKPRSPLSIDPVFVSPDFLYYAVKSVVKYDVNSTTLTSEQINSMVVNAIITYNDTALNNFKCTFKYSKFLNVIDSVPNAGIISNDTNVRIYKKLVPNFGVIQNVLTSFGQALTTEGAALGVEYNSDDLTAVSSSDFIYNGTRVHVDDDGLGNLRIVKSSGSTNLVVVPNVGTVDYSSGDLKFQSFRIDALPLGDNELRVYGITETKDFSTQQNVILALETSQIDVSVVATKDTTLPSTQFV